MESLIQPLELPLVSSRRSFRVGMVVDSWDSPENPLFPAV
jgi:hypothetical protein